MDVLSIFRIRHMTYFNITIYFSIQEKSILIVVLIKLKPTNISSNSKCSMSCRLSFTKL